MKLRYFEDEVTLVAWCRSAHLYYALGGNKMGFFSRNSKNYVYIFIEFSFSENGDLSFKVNGYVKSTQNCMQSNGKMDPSILDLIWMEGIKSFSKIASKTESWMFFCEIVKENAIVSEMIVRETVTGGYIWKRTESEEVFGKQQLTFRMSNLEEIQFT